MISSRLWLTHGARRGTMHEWEATFIILYRVKLTEAWADGCGTSYPSWWECLYSLKMGSAGLMCVWSADQLSDFIVARILAGREMHKRCYMMLHVVTNMGRRAQMLFQIKRKTTWWTSTSSFLQAFPGSYPSRSATFLEMFSLLGDCAIPCSSHLTDAVPGFHAGGLKHRSAPHWPSFTRALLVQSWRMRKSGSFPHSVLISLHCPCLYQVFRTSILTVCKHFITNYTCPKCVVVGFDITESCFTIRSQQVSREAELDVWTSANIAEGFKHSLLCLGGQGLTTAASASLPLTLGLKLSPVCRWKYGGFCYTYESDFEPQNENANLHLHSLASVLGSLLNEAAKRQLLKTRKKNHNIWGKLLKISNITWKETRKLSF